MHLEEFSEGTSPLHRLDPRVKFLFGLPPMAAVAVALGQTVPALALLCSVALTFLARLDRKKLLSRLAVVNAFVLMLWIFLPFSFPGREAFSVGPFTATIEGLQYAFSITLKCNSIVLLTIAVFGTSEIQALAHALVHLRVPRKLVYLFFFFYRYITVLHEEYTRLRRAMRVRCFRSSTGLHTYRSIAYLVGMLLVRSYERSESIYRAMLLRGFRGHFPVITHFHLHARDVIFGALMSVATLALLLL